MKKLFYSPRTNDFPPHQLYFLNHGFWILGVAEARVAQAVNPFSSNRREAQKSCIAFEAAHDRANGISRLRPQPCRGSRG